MPIPTLSQAFALAVEHHQAGRLADAEALYRQILAVQPRNAEALHHLGLIAQQVGRHDLAIKLISESLEVSPDNAAAFTNLGEACRSAGRLEEALAACQRALEIHPNLPAAHNCLGNVQRARGKSFQAAQAFRRVLELIPNSSEGCINLGVALWDQGQLDEAIAMYRQAIALNPRFSDAHNNLGVALRDKGQLDEAITAHRRAIALQPDDPGAYDNLGIALNEIGQVDEAIAAHRKAIALKPNHSGAHYNLGAALRNKGQWDEAAAAYRQALHLRPHFPEAESNLGNILVERELLPEAVACYRRALAVNPNYAEAHLGLAVVAWLNCEYQEAETAYRRAMACGREVADAHSNLGMLLLLLGHFEEGWREYEWRWKIKEARSTRRTFAQPQWGGDPLEGRTILLHAEQGLGDTLQFVRYAPLVARRGGRVILAQCQPGLQTLLARINGMAQVVARGEPLPAFDCHCPMVSLPLAFATRLETIPAEIPYLRADPGKVIRWRERLDVEKLASGETGPAPGGPLKVGLAWAGGARPHQPLAHLTDRRRSMSLSQFAPLAAVPGVVFVSLQKGRPAGQAVTPPPGMRLLDWTGELADFDDTAALIESLDLVISVDTSVVHLAGALGKPVWMLNRFDTCWRWLLARSDSPWYPTLRIFRQPRLGDWEPVISQVCQELRTLADSRAVDAEGILKP